MDDAAPTAKPSMHWPQGQPCSHCGLPTVSELHRLEGNGVRREYWAPLYHNAEKNLGFCGPACVADWMMVQLAVQPENVPVKKFIVSSLDDVRQGKSWRNGAK
jgi:hypothetical protein